MSDFLFSSANAADSWKEWYGVCKSCDGQNEPRKCGETRKVIYPSGRKIFFRKGEFMPVCRKCANEYREIKQKRALGRDLARAHSATLSDRHRCEPGYHYCSSCKQDKLHAEFSTRGRGAGLSGVCKACKRDYVNKWRAQREQPVQRIPTGRRGEYLGYSILPGGGVRRSYANGWSDTFADGSETWTRRELSA